MSNCSPKKDPKDRTAEFTYTECPEPEEGSPASITLTFDYIEKYWYEVRPPNIAKKTIVNGSKKEKLIKSTILLPDLLDAEDANGDNVTFTEQVYYQQEYEMIGSGDDIKSKPVFERFCKADTVYDEQYFYHIFEWPLTHTLPPRPAGGIAVTINTADPEACPVYFVVNESVTGTFSLARVDSQVTNVPNGSFVYHGGTQDNKIFFYYENTSNQQMIAVGDVINGWTISKVVNYNSEHLNNKSLRTTETVKRRVSETSKKNKTPGFIFINKNDGAEDRIINIGDAVSGTGIQKGTTVTDIQGLKIYLSQPLKYKSNEKVRNVRFTKTDLVNKISSQILCYAELTGSGANFIKDQYYAKNTPSTPQYTSSVYHVFDDTKLKNIQLTTSNDIKVDAKNKNDLGGSDDSTNRNYYKVSFKDGTTISNKNDIQINITSNRPASGLIDSFVYVSKLEIIDSNTFHVWFKRNDNRNNTFVRGWSVTRVENLAQFQSNRIQVIAGRGITDRSAVCGVYVSTDKKFYTYTPLFYGVDNYCEPTYMETDLGEYVLGSVKLSDNSLLINSEFLCVIPLTDSAYQINNIYWTYFKRPALKTELELWVPKLENFSFLEIQNEIKLGEEAKLGERTVISVKDAECDNTIYPDHTKVYYPHQELKTFDDYIQPIKEDITFDDCVNIRTPQAYTQQEISEVITTNLQGAFDFSNINLPSEMYKRVISDENSLQNTLLRAVNSISGSIPTITTIPNLPPLIEGEDKSSKIHKTQNAYRIPPRFKSLEYIIDDLSFISDFDLLPYSEDNNIEITIRSIPRWMGAATPTAGQGMTIPTNYDAEGFVQNVQVVAAPFPGSEIIPGIPSPLVTSWEMGPFPDFIWHGADTNYQETFKKIMNFRVNEVSNNVANAIKNKGNPFMDEPPYAKLTAELKPSDTTVRVTDTSQFMSSGYIIIPKYIVKKDKNNETSNESLYHYYLGEEIIYYKDKTETEFLFCTREMFETTNTFEEIVDTGSIESGVTYIINTIGSVDWISYGAPEGYGVGTIFTAVKDGSGTTESGTVYLFESTLTPFENTTYVRHSYESNNYLSQFWPVQIQNKNV